MRIIILGAGRVGESVAETLVSEANDITVVDPDPERLRMLEDRLDLRGGSLPRQRAGTVVPPPCRPSLQSRPSESRHPCGSGRRVAIRLAPFEAPARSFRMSKPETLLEDLSASVRKETALLLAAAVAEGLLGVAAAFITGTPARISSPARSSRFWLMYWWTV